MSSVSKFLSFYPCINDAVTAQMLRMSTLQSSCGNHGRTKRQLDVQANIAEGHKSKTLLSKVTEHWVVSQPPKEEKQENSSYVRSPGFFSPEITT